MQIPDFWASIGSAIWWFLTIFFFIAYLMALFSVITDLFRDRKLGGFAKAVWLIFLLFLPLLTVLVYLIARGRGMSERSEAQAAAVREAGEDYIRSVAGGNQATEIAKAKELLDAGAITPEEFAQIKNKVLAV